MDKTFFEKNKKSLIIGGVVVVVLLWMFSSYNGLVNKDEAVEEKWGNVETQYQMRADKISNLVETVKGYATYESETLQKVVEARAKATSINISVDELTEENLAKFQQAQDELSQCLKSLLAIQESYPDLKASEQFLSLQDEISGCENRIQNAREEYNAAVKTYNVKVRSFPTNIMAGMFGFDKKAMFKAAAGTENAPKVQF